MNVTDAGFFGADSSIGFDPGVELSFTTGSDSPGVFDPDGDVDGRHYLLCQRNPSVGNLANWQANYGTGSLASSATVPEPGTLFLVVEWRRINVSDPWESHELV